MFEDASTGLLTKGTCNVSLTGKKGSPMLGGFLRRVTCLTSLDSAFSK